MKPGWRVFAGAAAVAAVWTLGLCAWTLVSRSGPTLDLGPTVAIDAPTEPETVSAAPLPSADTSATGPTDPADVPDAPDAPDVPAPTATNPAPPVAPQPAPTARSTNTARSADPAQTAPVEAVAQESVPVEAAPAGASPALAPTRADGWQQPGRPASMRPATEYPWESVGALEPETPPGASTPSRDKDGGPHGSRHGCDDDRHRWDRTTDEKDSKDSKDRREPHGRQGSDPKDRRDAWHAGTTTGDRP